jgi:hypothetical protein
MNQVHKDIVIIGIISDTHIPSRVQEIPESIIQDFQEKNVDFVFHLGDFTTLKTYNHLIDVFGKDKVIAISGNMDNHEIAKILPNQRELDILGHKIFLIHGSGGPKGIIKRLNRSYDLDMYDIIIFGHVHHPFNERRGGKLYINPGTPTDKRFTDVNSYGILELTESNINFKIKYL